MSSTAYLPIFGMTWTSSGTSSAASLELRLACLETAVDRLLDRQAVDGPLLLSALALKEIPQHPFAMGAFALVKP